MASVTEIFNKAVGHLRAIAGDSVVRIEKNNDKLRKAVEDKNNDDIVKSVNETTKAVKEIKATDTVSVSNFPDLSQAFTSIIKELQKEVEVITPEKLDLSKIEEALGKDIDLSGIQESLQTIADGIDMLDIPEAIDNTKELLAIAEKIDSKNNGNLEELLKQLLDKEQVFPSLDLPSVFPVELDPNLVEKDRVKVVLRDDQVSSLTQQMGATNAPLLTALDDKATETKQDVIIANQTNKTQFTKLTDGTDDASITTNADRTTNLDGVKGLDTNAMVFGRVSDTVVKNMRLDSATEALMTVSYAHHETHAGSHFNYRDSYALAKNSVKEHLVITPDTTKWAHMIFGVSSTGGQVNVEIFEDTTVSANGTAESCINRNRNSAVTKTTIVYEAPTVVTDGTILFKQTFGVDEKKSAGGGTRDSEEIVLKQNTIYLVRTTELDVNSSTINVDFDWYEHTDRN